MEASLSDLHQHSRGDLRHWVLPTQHLDAYGDVISLNYVWGETLDVELGQPKSLMVVQMPVPNSTLGVSQPLKVRVDSVYIRVFEGQESHPLTLTLNLPSYVISSFVAQVAWTHLGTLVVQQLSQFLAQDAGTGLGLIQASAAGAGSFTSNLLQLGSALCTTNIIGGFAVTGTYTNPQQGFVFPTVNISAGAFQIGASNNPIMTVTVPTFPVSPSAAGSIVDPANACVSQVALALYVATTKVISSGSYGVKNPSSSVDCLYDFLDLVVDTYNLPFGSVNSFTGRGWTLRLPHPIELGVGEALILTISVNSACVSAANIVVYAKALVCDVV